MKSRILRIHLVGPLIKRTTDGCNTYRYNHQNEYHTKYSSSHHLVYGHVFRTTKIVFFGEKKLLFTPPNIFRTYQSLSPNAHLYYPPNGTSEPYHPTTVETQ